MANWNLSVDLRGQGDDLARTLRTSAAQARALGAAARGAKDEVKQLGTVSGVTAKAVTKLGDASQGAARRLTVMARQAKAAAADMRRLERALADTDAQIRGMADRVRITADIDDQTTTGLATIRAAIADLRTLSNIDVGASLNDNTGAGLASIRASLTDLERQSPVILRATLDDDTAAGAAQVRQAITNLRALSPIDITANFDGDPAQLAAAAAAVGALRDHADNANTALATMTTRAAAAAAALNRLQQEAQDVSRVLRTLRGRAAAAAAALDELGDRARHAATGLRSLGTGANRANGHLTTLSGNTRTLRGDLDTLDGSLTQVTGHMGGLRGALGRVSTTSSTTSGNLAGTNSSMKNLIIGAIALGSALLPIAAAAVPIAAGLGAAGVAIGAFGVAVGGQIMALTEAAEAEEKLEQAVREHGSASAEAAKAETEYLRLVSEMPPASREAAAALAVLKDEYKDWSNALAGDTMPVVTKSMGLFGAMLPALTPLVRGTSAELDNLMNVAAGGMTTPGFDRFMTKFTQFASESLARGTAGLIEFSEALERGDVGDDLQEFLDYARTNAPLVGETLRNLGQAVIHLLAAFSDMGVSVLTAVNALAQLINAIPSSALSTFVQLYAVLKLVSLGMGLVAAMAGAGAVAGITAFGRALMFGGVGPAITGVVQRMSALQKATVGLAVLAVVAIGIDKLADKARGAPPDIDRLTTSLKELASTGKFTGELQKTFGDLDGLVDKVKKLDTEAKKAGETALGFRIPVLDDVADWLAGNANDIAKGGESLKALEEDFASLDKAMAGMVASGNSKQAVKDFDLIKTALKGAGKSTAEITALFPEYGEAMGTLAAEQKLAAAGMGVFGAQALATKDKLNEQKASADGLRMAIVALNDVNRAAMGGQIGFEAAIDAAGKAAKENAGALKMVNGELDLNDPKAQAAATTLQDLAAKTDEYATAARESGASWESVNAIYDRGTASLVKTGMQMGLTKTQAEALAASILEVPESHETTIEMRREDAIAGLDSVIAKIEATPGTKSVTVKALTKDAISLLESLGYKTKTLPDGSVQVTARTGNALSGLAAVRNARDGLSDKTITITTHYRITGSGAAQQARRSGAYGTQLANAEGSITDYYANGGVRAGGVRHFANGSENHVAQIAPAGAMRVWAEPETMGEGYVPFAPSKRPRSRAITEEIVRRLGGDPAAIQWNAEGNVTDWRYDPTSGSLYSPSDAAGAARKTRKVKGKDVSYFDLGALEKRLKTTSDMTRRWDANLAKVADRAGGDVADALAAMGTDGYELTKKMATGSTAYINQMSTALRGLASTAKASLADYTREITKATVNDEAFSRNLATLAGRGYGDLAKQLAAQGDAAAGQLATAAVGDNRKAAAANTAAGRANAALTSDQVQDLVAIIAAVKTSKTGIHDVADTTGIGEDVIIAIAGKATTQIKSALGSRSARFMADLARGQRGLSYANGGIREGIYATQGGAVTFAEPSTGGEAYIPLGASKRRAATNVLRDVAGRFGVGLTDMAATRPVVIVRSGGDTHVAVTAVRTGASASDIGTQVGRSMRRVRRGGVSARAAA